MKKPLSAVKSGKTVMCEHGIKKMVCKVCRLKGTV